MGRVLAMVAAVVLIGQVIQVAGLASRSANHRIALRVMTQLLIFSPVFIAAAMAARRGDAYARRVAFVPTDRVATRLASGSAAAAIALIVHEAAARRLTDLGGTAASLIEPVRLSHAVQILGEDLGIGILLASSLRRFKPATAAVVTGSLFALGHIPAMLTAGQPLSEFVGLVADGLLAASVVSLLFRVRDVWAIWPVHVIMDLTQFLER